MKVIIPQNNTPNSILVQNINPQNGMIIVNKNNIPFGFVIKDVDDMFSIQRAIESDAFGNKYFDTLIETLEFAQKNIGGEVTFDYFKTNE